MKVGRMHIIEIDMGSERKRIKDVEYTPEERVALLSLCDLFEAGEFGDARMLISYWDKEWLEYILPEMWYILNADKLNPDYRVIKD